jgi:transglutaminase-like putative cysteine protease
VIRYHVRHRTEYDYAVAATSGQTLAYLVPRARPGQTLVSSVVTVDPAPDHRHEHDDVYGNHVVYFAVERPHDRLVVEAVSEVDIDPGTIAPAARPAPGAADVAWDEVAAVVARDRSLDGILALECTLDSPLVARTGPLADFARPSFPPGRPLVDGVRDLATRIHAEFTFDSKFSDLSTPLADVLEARRGVCQDFAHLAIGCLRSLGLPARYVSGYIETVPPEGQPRLEGADASHAWCSAFVPGRGWYDVDPTNAHAPAERRVTVAWGRDYGDVAPLRGVVFGPPGGQELRVAVDVTRA